MQNLVNFAFFFGVKKEGLFLQGNALLGVPQTPFPYFLRREERSKEASTYPKSFPIWKDLTEKSRSFFQGFGMTHRAFAPAG